MGYFSNGTEGMRYEEEYCNNCVHSTRRCCVWDLHLAYNGNDEWQAALDELIPRDKQGYNLICSMFLSQEILDQREKAKQLNADKERLKKWNEASKR